MVVTLEYLREHLRLEGERIIRISTGKEVNRTSLPYFVVSIGQGRIQYHRAKFWLAHGWLPPTVDHRDRNPRNNALYNLRPATQQQQLFNQGSRRKRKYSLPHGVHPGRRGKRFRATLQVDGRYLSLGVFDTPEQASVVVEAKRLEVQGEFYRHYPHAQEDQR